MREKAQRGLTCSPNLVIEREREREREHGHEHEHEHGEGVVALRSRSSHSHAPLFEGADKAAPLAAIAGFQSSCGVQAASESIGDRALQ